MTNINPISNLQQFFIKNDTTVNKKDEEYSLLSDNSALDSVEISHPKSEKFEEVFTEMSKNVPDRTTTVEEKNLAISYIDRMLACEDIPEDLKIYWQNKKDVIEQEIQNIKNQEQTGTGEKIADVAAEFENFTNKFWNKELSSDLPFESYNEYYITYYNTYISFCDRFLNCSDITDEQRTEYQNMKMYAMFDLNNHKTDMNNYLKDKNQNTESFYDVFSEMCSAVPDSTSTIPEKQLAISYINRMLSCDDIPNAEYWEGKKSEIEKEIENFNK